MHLTKAYAAQSATSPLGPFQLRRREPTPRDVQIDILYCGVCHSDLHTARSEWGPSTYPCVPGHEIVGRVTAVGDEVENFHEGDFAAVGCMVDSDRTCPNCRDGLEQFCESGATFTYNSKDKHGTAPVTYGGYSQRIVVDQDFVLRISDKIDLASAAPLLCAGITTYSPLRHWEVSANHKVGVVGLGGLGHMGLKFAHAFGAHVVLFTHSPSKTEDAKRLGADEVILTKDPDQLKKHANSFDFILDTVSAQHDIGPYLDCLKRDGTMTLVGAPPDPLPTDVFSLIRGRKSLAGSLIGGIPETQEMLDFCCDNNITCDVEMIRMDQINEAYERMLKSDVKYRFVIDIASLG